MHELWQPAIWPPAGLREGPLLAELQKHLACVIQAEKAAAEQAAAVKEAQEDEPMEVETENEQAMAAPGDSAALPTTAQMVTDVSCLSCCLSQWLPFAQDKQAKAAPRHLVGV